MQPLTCAVLCALQARVGNLGLRAMGSVTLDRRGLFGTAVVYKPLAQLILGHTSLNPNNRELLEKACIDDWRKMPLCSYALRSVVHAVDRLDGDNWTAALAGEFLLQPLSNCILNSRCCLDVTVQI